MRQILELTSDKLKDIYTNEAFRNQVAYAHGCYTAFPNSTFKHFKTCSYPIEYIVTQQQIDEVQKELERAKKQCLIDYNNKLVFIGMGMTYEPRFEGDVCNHRIRTEFINSKGNKYFIELGTGIGEDMRCDHSIDRTRQDALNNSHNRQGEFYNFAGLETREQMPKYTLEKVLSLVNKTFNCNFKEIIIDNHTLNTDELICKSPL